MTHACFYVHVRKCVCLCAHMPGLLTTMQQAVPARGKPQSGQICIVQGSLCLCASHFAADGMEISVERRIRGAVGLAEEISHPNLITLAGNWENDEAIYVVEEYASHGDLLQDSLSCPEK